MSCMKINCLCMKGENKVCFSKLLCHDYLDSCLWNKEATPHFCIFQKVLYFPAISNRHSIALSIPPEKTLKLVDLCHQGRVRRSPIMLPMSSFLRTFFRLLNKQGQNVCHVVLLAFYLAILCLCVFICAHVYTQEFVQLCENEHRGHKPLSIDSLS